MIGALNEAITLYRDHYGEPEYRYFKKRVSWTKFRRRPGEHSTPIGDGEEVSKEEYEANIAESVRHRTDAFMGRFPESYWEYGRKMVKDGWREALIKDVQAA